jgi:hypothetical protein
MLLVKEFWGIFQYFPVIVPHPDVINFPMGAIGVTGAIGVGVPELWIVLEFQQQKRDIKPTNYRK